MKCIKVVRRQEKKLQLPKMLLVKCQSWQIFKMLFKWDSK